MTLTGILRLPDGHAKTAALVAWVQELFEPEVPVLVGGAAVELITGGAYTTGDLDFVGSVPGAVRDRLKAAGFEKKGRHWIHEAGRVFLEFPSAELGPGEESIELEVAGKRLRVLEPEALVVDRLAAWEFWRSSIDGANAYLVLLAAGDRFDTEKLARLAARRDLRGALGSLLEFANRFKARDPTREELERWADRREP